MQRAPSAKRGAVWLAIDAIAWLASVTMLMFSIAHTNEHNVLPSILAMAWWGGAVVVIPVRNIRIAHQAWRETRQQHTTVR